MKTKTGWMFLVVAVVCLSVSDTQAADGKTSPGGACQPAYNSYQFYKDSLGRVFNSSTGGQYWTCPLTRDVIAGKSKGIAEAWLWFIDMHFDSNGSCTLYSRSSAGDYVSASTRNTSGSNSSAQLLHFNSALSSSSRGYYYFRCYLPGTYEGYRSGVVSFAWNETN